MGIFSWLLRHLSRFWLAFICGQFLTAYWYSILQTFLEVYHRLHNHRNFSLNIFWHSHQVVGFECKMTENKVCFLGASHFCADTPTTTTVVTVLEISLKKRPTSARRVCRRRVSLSINNSIWNRLTLPCQWLHFFATKVALCTVRAMVFFALCFWERFICNVSGISCVLWHGTCSASKVRWIYAFFLNESFTLCWVLWAITHDEYAENLQTWTLTAAAAAGRDHLVEWENLKWLLTLPSLFYHLPNCSLLFETYRTHLF